MRVLGIESSCDETAVAVYDGERGLLAHQLYSQVQLHAQYGGVVPELASRDHVRKLLPLVEQVLADAKLDKRDLNGIAYTAGPGLIGALFVGAAFGRTLAYALGIPAIGVHHMEGHLLAPMLEAEPPEFPFVALLVSGGHTMLVDVARFGDYRLLGQTLDDAAGEAFDKTAKLLGLSYPGGPALAALALKGRSDRFPFPRPMTDRPGLDFSFSGLKTHTATLWQAQQQDDQTRADIAAGFEKAVADTLFIKCKRALQATGARTLVIAGGVGANQRLRSRLSDLSSQVVFPRPEFCTDNGAMIAYVGYLRLRRQQSEPMSITARPRWSLEDLSADSTQRNSS